MESSSDGVECDSPIFQNISLHQVPLLPFEVGFRFTLVERRGHIFCMCVSERIKAELNYCWTPNENVINNTKECFSITFFLSFMEKLFWLDNMFVVNHELDPTV